MKHTTRNMEQAAHNKQSNSKKAGFTLVETLVAITIFLTVSTAAMSVLQSSIQNRRVADQESTATFLASEGIEYVRHLRDTNYIKDRAGQDILWTEGIQAGCLSGNQCYVDPSIMAGNPAVMSCGGGGGEIDTCPNLKFDEDDGYQYSSGTTSPFVRTITFLPLEPGGDINDALRVVSTVRWQNRGSTYSIVVRENIFNW